MVKQIAAAVALVAGLAVPGSAMAAPEPIHRPSVQATWGENPTVITSITGRRVLRTTVYETEIVPTGRVPRYQHDGWDCKPTTTVGQWICMKATYRYRILR